MAVRVQTPEGELFFADVARLRFDAEDGARGVLPRHEAARVILEAGPVEVTRAGGSVVFVATEGGMVWITPTQVRLISGWAIQAESLEELREQVLAQAARRRRIEAEARAQALRQEQAARRALVDLARRPER
jgi:F0F1-type ATP synthase epsilon subunit